MIRKKLKIACDAIDLSIKDNVAQENVNDEISKTTNEITSKYFNKSIQIQSIPKPLWQRVYEIECNMNDHLKPLLFLSPICAVYNPIEYASTLHSEYLRKGLNGGSVPILMIGMNPGPWGMCQTGVPFGYIPAVRDWMKITGEVNKPKQELAIRPVTGLHCEKREQSGKRFWGLFKDICGNSAENFFKRCFVYNYCPLAFFQKSGKNITPAELKGEIRQTLQVICTNFMQQVIALISPEIIISIGRYTEDRVNSLIKLNLIDAKIIHKCMPHPSPRSVNNTNWNDKAKQWLIDNDILKYFEN